MNKFEQDGFLWFVDEEKGIYVCKCPRASALLWDEYVYMSRGNFGIDNFYEEARKWYKKYSNQMNNLFGKAKANIDAGEVIDSERGMELARKRLIEKLAAYRASFYSDILDAAKAFEEQIEKRVEGNKRIGLNAAVRISELEQGE